MTTKLSEKKQNLIRNWKCLSSLAKMSTRSWKFFLFHNFLSFNQSFEFNTNFSVVLFVLNQLTEWITHTQYSTMCFPSQSPQRLLDETMHKTTNHTDHNDLVNMHSIMKEFLQRLIFCQRIQSHESPFAETTVQCLYSEYQDSANNLKAKNKATNSKPIKHHHIGVFIVSSFYRCIFFNCIFDVVFLSFTHTHSMNCQCSFFRVPNRDGIISKANMNERKFIFISFACVYF